MALETGVHRFNLNFPLVLFLQLEALAKRRGLSVTDVVRAAVELELEITEHHMPGDVLGLQAPDGAFRSFSWSGARYTHHGTAMSGIQNLSEAMEIVRRSRKVIPIDQPSQPHANSPVLDPLPQGS
jgi:hypothetical protein